MTPQIWQRQPSRCRMARRSFSYCSRSRRIGISFSILVEFMCLCSYRRVARFDHEPGLLFRIEKLEVVQLGLEQQFRITAVEIGSRQKISTDHLETIASRFV